MKETTRTQICTPVVWKVKHSRPYKQLPAGDDRVPTSTLHAIRLCPEAEGMNIHTHTSWSHILHLSLSESSSSLVICGVLNDWCTSLTSQSRALRDGPGPLYTHGKYCVLLTQRYKLCHNQCTTDNAIARHERGDRVSQQQCSGGNYLFEWLRGHPAAGNQGMEGFVPLMEAR